MKTREQAGIELPDAEDPLRELFAAASYDTLDNLAWPERGERWRSSRVEPGGSRPGSRVLEARPAGPPRPATRRAHRASTRRAVGLSGDDLPVYDCFRLGGLELVPGYRHEELKGAQQVALAASLRHRLVGDLRGFVRAGAGNVFALPDDIQIAGTRWGVAVGAMVPTRVGPVSAELGVRDDGSTLVSLALGWN